ncbi:hypothetical protein [Roseimicrobium sp. ORNL1]|uniref:hypothetical protein n=1 Tax=Roseimicrobium sp. ORNL1 TaxID=2711231 RepID=UPI0013E2055A|nr:hypothetical protein [Roseimicrobium sp. ORNL1]QIF05474.1 hypothetical protein G5S37_29570 [Roseimicrobium sp. ORNL1]
MAKPRRLSITVVAIAAVTLAVVVTFAVLIWMPLPEERSFLKLAKVNIGPISLSGATAREAVAAVNAQLEKEGQTHLRLFIPETTQFGSGTISMELDAVSVADCARYISELSDARMYGTEEGITIDIRGCYSSSTPVPPPSRSWRREFRDWVRYTLPYKWKRFWSRSDPADPFASLGAPSGLAPSVPSLPAPAPSSSST